MSIEFEHPGDLHQLLTEANDDEKRQVFETFFNTSTNVRVTIASCACFQQRDSAIDILDVLVDHGYEVTDARRSHLLQAVKMNEEQQQYIRPGHKLPDHMSTAAGRKKCEKHIDKLWKAAQKKRKEEVKEEEKRQRDEVKRVEAQQKKEAKRAARQQKGEDKQVGNQQREEKAE